MIAGGIEGLFMHTPVENMKVKLIHDKFKPEPQFRNMFHGIYRVAKDQGFKGISSGAVITMCKELTNNAIRFPTFATLRPLFTPIFGDNVLVRDLFVGWLTGCISVAINQPIDVLKTNLQGLDAHKYKGIFDCARQILANEGIMGLYKGWRPRLARASIEVSVTFASYHKIKGAVLNYLDMVE
mmetsp:Transcript_13217/g.15307  ORF Transcript_13217/g.15307 Transcript_13217/m.15307 type:complete len:183 (+) Transcript_13217:363-911(+)